LELPNNNMLINHKKVERLMKQLGIKSLIRAKKYRSYKGDEGKISPNIIARNFTAERPNKK